MSGPPKKDRRAVPRFKVSCACSISALSTDEKFPKQAVLGYVKDLSRVAVAVLLPSNETYGVDASSLGKQVEMTLALPVGYVRLTGTLVRYSPDDSGQYFFVFMIQDSKERSRYNAYLDSLESELSAASNDSLKSRLTLIETKPDPN